MRVTILFASFLHRLEHFMKPEENELSGLKISLHVD